MCWSAFAWPCAGKTTEWCTDRVSFVGVRHNFLSTSDTAVALSRNVSYLLLPANAIRTARGSGLLGRQWFLNG